MSFLGFVGRLILIAAVICFFVSGFFIDAKRGRKD